MLRPIHVATALVAFAGAFTAAGGARAADKPTIALMPFRVEDLASNEVQRLNVLMRARAATRGGYDLQTDAMTTQLVDASQSLGLDCDVAAVACGVKIGKIADVQFVLLGRAVGNLDGRVGIDARVIDVAKGVEVRHASALVPADADGQAEALTGFAEALFGQAPLASFTMDADPPGAEVVVDGTARGVAPLQTAIGELAPGEHFVVVRKKGYLPYRSRVTVKEGEVPALSAQLAVDPEALHTGPTALQTAVPFIVAGSGALVAVGGAVAIIIGYQPYATFQQGSAQVSAVDAEHKSALRQDDIDQITAGHKLAEQGANDWNNYGRLSVVGGIVGASVGLAAAVGGTVWGVVLLSDDGEDAAGAAATKAKAPRAP